MADVTGDGLVDIVGELDVLRSVTVLPGLGRGAFGAAVLSGGGGALSPGGVSSITLADLNGDGLPDLVSGASSSPPGGRGPIATQLNQGGGTFGPRVLYYANYGTAYVAVADVNADGKPDVVVSNTLGGGGLGASTLNTPSVWVFPNTGNGTLGAAVGYGAVENSGYDAQADTAVDLNGDGKVDLATTNWLNGTASVLLNQGGGTFGPVVQYGTGLYPGPLAVADVTGDGRPDLITLGQGKGTVTVLPNRGGGVIGQATTAPASVPQTQTVADVNGDGRPDLILSRASPSQSVTVELNAGDGSFPAASTTTYAVDATAGPNYVTPPTVTAADVTGDGRPDLLVLTPAKAVAVLVNRGTGTFAAAVAYGTGQVRAPLLVADVNGDGRTDLVTGTTNKIAGGSTYTGDFHVLLNAGAGTFAAPATQAVNGSSGAMAVADLDADGLADVVVAPAEGVGLLAYYGRADGTFDVPVAYAATGTKFVGQLGIADTDGDGRPDLILAGQHSPATSYVVYDAVVLRNGGGRAFAGGSVYSTASTYVSGTVATPTMLTGDYSGDGRLDLILNRSIALTNTGTGGTFAATAIPGSAVGTAAQIHSILASVDGDGSLALVRSYGSVDLTPGAVVVQHYNGDGTFSAPDAYDTQVQGGPLAAADLNGDGKTDLVTVSAVITPAFGSFVTLLLNHRPAVPPPLASVAGGQLLLNPAAIGGAVTLAQANGTVTVSAPGAPPSSFAAADLTSIRITCGVSGSNAALTVAGTVTVPLTFVGLGGTDMLTVSGSAMLAAGPSGGGLTVLPFASVTIPAGGRLTLAGAAAVDRTVLSTGTLADSGILDLDNGDAIVTGSTVGAVTALAKTGFAGGTWAGVGLASSAAAADAKHLAAVGVIQNANGSAALYSTFDGVAVASTAVLVKSTVYGDTNLDGVVTAADYTRLDAGFVGHLTGWANGDVNYDGVVDGSDYALADNAFNRQGVATPAAVVVTMAAGDRRPVPAAWPAVAPRAAPSRDAWWDDRRHKSHGGTLGLLG